MAQAQHTSHGDHDQHSHHEASVHGSVESHHATNHPTEHSKHKHESATLSIPTMLGITVGTFALLALAVVLTARFAPINFG